MLSSKASFSSLNRMKTIITHSGNFHADDVFATATLFLAYPDEELEITRTRDKEAIEAGDIVFDVGGVYDTKILRFDHHQEGGAGVRDNGLPYAAFGLVWKEFGAQICGGDFFIAKQIDDGIIAGMDATDNGVKIFDELYKASPFEISQYVKAHNPTWREEDEWGEKADSERLLIFKHLVIWAKEFLLREIKIHKDKNSAYETVKKFYKESGDKRIIVLPRYYPSEDVLIEFPEPIFVIYPQSDGRAWAAKALPKDKGSFESRKPFPESWAGKMAKELADITGVSDALFCHNKRFLATAVSREGAIKLAELALNSK